MYDEAKGKIAFYEGDLEKKQIVRAIGTRLPGFMIPNGDGESRRNFHLRKWKNRP